MVQPQIRYDDGAAYERMMAGAGSQARSFSIGWRRPLACDGSTLAAAAVPLSSCS